MSDRKTADAAAPGPAGGAFGRFEIRVAERRLHVDGQPVAIGSRAFDLLAALVARRERIVSKDELIDVVWPGLVVEDNNLQVQISALRKVLGTQAIATVPGRGYQFTVAATAPGAAASAVVPKRDAASMHPSARASAGAKSRLLVADDNKVNRLLLCRSLELMGHDVTSVENGRAALERLLAERFDLLLLDLEMPELDGFGLLERRAGDPALREVPVIVTSSLEGAAAVARCIELGADDYLHKPVNPVLLKARVDSTLERKHLRDRERELLARLAPDLRRAAAPGSDATGVRRGEATLLAARLRDPEALTPVPPAHETLELLGSWATLMLDAIEAQGGRVHHFMGDAVAAVFGLGDAPSARADAAWAAVQAAVEMRELVAQFNVERQAQGKPPIVLDIGIAAGEVVAGSAGTSQRATYVCIGAAVRRATRLEALAAGSPGGSTLIDGATEAALHGRVATDALEPVVLPGAAAPMPVHALKTTA